MFRHPFRFAGLTGCLIWATLSFLPFAAAADEDILRGQIVCSQCWFEADRTEVAYGTPSDLQCARNCGAAGIPLSLAVRDESSGDYRLLSLDDAPGGAAGWSPWVGKFVEIRGTLSENRLRDPRSVKLLAAMPWPAPVPAEPASKRELQWTDPDGRTVALDSYLGDVIVLNFWATWCAPCVREMPDLVAIQKKFADDGVQVLGAAAESVEDTAQVMEFARKYRLNFPVLLGADADQMESLGLTRALPSTAILDRDGHVVERIAGAVRPRALRRSIRRVLAQRNDEHNHAAVDSTQDPDATHATEFAEAPEPSVPTERVEPVEADDTIAEPHDHDHGEEDGHGHPPNRDDASLVPS